MLGAANPRTSSIDHRYFEIIKVFRLFIHSHYIDHVKLCRRSLCLVSIDTPSVQYIFPKNVVLSNTSPYSCLLQALPIHLPFCHDTHCGSTNRSAPAITFSRDKIINPQRNPIIYIHLYTQRLDVWPFTLSDFRHPNFHHAIPQAARTFDLTMHLNNKGNSTRNFCAIGFSHSSCSYGSPFQFHFGQWFSPSRAARSLLLLHCLLWLYSRLCPWRKQWTKPRVRLQVRHRRCLHQQPSLGPCLGIAQRLS
jgi:hypothetical protein